MPGDDAGMEMEVMTESALRRTKDDSGAENHPGPDQSRAQIQAHGDGGGTANSLRRFPSCFPLI